MATLTVNIVDQSTEQQVKAFLDKLGLDYSINTEVPSCYNWWEDELLVKELDKRSEDLKSGEDQGMSFEDIKRNLLNR